MAKFSVVTNDLKTAVAAAANVINSHTTVPILSNVLVKVSADQVVISATDLEVSISCALPAEVTEPGDITVAGKLFSSFLNASPNGVVDFSSDESKVTLSAGKSKVVLHALPADEYPNLPTSTDVLSFSVESSKFRKLVEQVTFAASREEARGAVLMSVLFEISGSTLTAVTTDGYRLAKIEEAFEGSTIEDGNYLIPVRALQQAAKNASQSDTVEVSILGGDKHIAFRMGSVSIIVRLVAGAYPNYRQVIPTSFDQKMTISTPSLVSALKRASLLAGDRANMIKMALENNSLIITAQSDTTGNAYENLDCELSGEPMTIGFNAVYLLDILREIDSAQTEFHLSGSMSPVKIMPVQDDTTQSYILMPLRG